MVVIAVTGNFASGKTEVSSILRALGARVFDADASAHELMRKKTALTKKVAKYFGEEYLNPDGSVNRKKLAAYVFRHKTALRALNKMIHPAVIGLAKAEIKRCSRKAGFLVLDVPLLFESGMDKYCDTCIVVDASRDHLFERGQKRGVPKALVGKILSNQWPARRKVKLADWVIRNDGSLKELRVKTRRVFEDIRRRFNS